MGEEGRMKERGVEEGGMEKERRRMNCRKNMAGWSGGRSRRRHDTAQAHVMLGDDSA
jgi:hypothetical protein